MRTRGRDAEAGVRVQDLRADDAEAAGRARFEISLAGGESARAERVALCTGGLSLPKTGSDGWGYQTAERLGHPLRRRYPALVPLLTRDSRWHELAGVSLPARLSAMRDGVPIGACTGDLLFTHKGFSGPVVLDVSHHLTRETGAKPALLAGWLGDDAETWDARLLTGGARTLQGFARAQLPRRLADRLVALSGVAPERALARLTREERSRVAATLGACPLEISGDESYRSAEVTGGGVPLEAVATRSLESRHLPGLYFAGEILDVTGRIGGFNFLWAWASGRRVGLAVAAAS